MSTRAFASSVVNAPIDEVWKVLRNFTAPAILFKSTVKSVELEDNADPSKVGAVRLVRFVGDAVKRQQLLELSDLNYRIVWETSAPVGEQIADVAATITTVQLYRITDTNQTYISWSADFSSDATGKFVIQEQADYAANLKDIKAYFSK
eukprot:TRINITY_DN18043_c0_g1_i1.p1 TRINITY_DN18043_c0_g1~~TRINITY_DN18043_c0_g1_i1.p1  ORF type:complete len:149 (+),score=25.73 TRINITY_DN18043_c0_g1_i1:44-490(+)